MLVLPRFLTREAQLPHPFKPHLQAVDGVAHADAQVLVKMLNAGLFAELNGCVSTGKEANVYQAMTGEGTDLAVKVYKTSILTFKDRDRCRTLLPVSGRWRAAQGPVSPLLGWG